MPERTTDGRSDFSLVKCSLSECGSTFRYLMIGNSVPSNIIHFSENMEMIRSQWRFAFALSVFCSIAFVILLFLSCVLFLFQRPPSSTDSFKVQNLKKKKKEKRALVNRQHQSVPSSRADMS